MIRRCRRRPPHICVPHHGAIAPVLGSECQRAGSSVDPHLKLGLAGDQRVPAAAIDWVPSLTGLMTDKELELEADPVKDSKDWVFDWIWPSFHTMTGGPSSIDWIWRPSWTGFAQLDWVVTGGSGPAQGQCPALPQLWTGWTGCPALPSSGLGGLGMMTDWGSEGPVLL